jgi:hypothetical protein
MLVWASQQAVAALELAASFPQVNELQVPGLAGPSLADFVLGKI